MVRQTIHENSYHTLFQLITSWITYYLLDDVIYHFFTISTTKLPFSALELNFHKGMIIIIEIFQKIAVLVRYPYFGIWGHSWHHFTVLPNFTT